MRHLLTLAAVVALTAPATLQAQQQLQPSIQQQFDAAETARQAGNWPEALRLLEALEARTRNARTRAIVQVRKGAVLIALGRFEEGAASIRQGLPGMPEDDATLFSDRFLGVLHLGLFAEHELDYAEALRQFRLAAAIPVAGTERLLAQRGLIQTQLFTDAAGALRDADAALQLAAAEAAQDRTLAGQLHTLRGRALLNLRRYDEARRELQTALRLLGNLTLRVDRADLLARSDLAIAALLADDPEDARRYLAYTGAGLFERGYIMLSPFNRPAPCGGALAPDDVAVLEFIVGEDGSVLDVKPIYASHQGEGAIQLARAARGWRFDAESARPVPALLRSVVRIEVRCSSADNYVQASAGDAELPLPPEGVLRQAVSDRNGRTAETLLAELRTLTSSAGGDRQALLAVLLAVGKHPALGHLEREGFLRQALPIAAQLDLPGRTMAAIGREIAYEHWAQGERRTSIPPQEYSAMLALPEISRSAAATSYLRLFEARAHYFQGNYDRAATLAEALRTSPAATPDSQIVRDARELEVAIHAARGDMEAASAAHRAMGAEARRCGLEPRSLGLRASSSDFPTEAWRWGFEGWAINEIAVTPAGRVTGSRTVAAYPPFVFGDATTEITQRTRYTPFFTPDGAACTIGGYRVFFRLPDRR